LDQPGNKVTEPLEEKFQESKKDQASKESSALPTHEKAN
jgi:hypothetical protein